MFAVKIRDVAPNSRVIGLCYQSFSSEPYGSNFGWFAFWRDRSDPAAHGKHYAYFWKQKLFIYLALHKMSPT